MKMKMMRCEENRARRIMRKVDGHHSIRIAKAQRPRDATSVQTGSQAVRVTAQLGSQPAPAEWRDPSSKAG